MLGLSTRRDLFISAIISYIFFVERVVKVPNVERNIAFFGSRSAEQAINDVITATPCDELRKRLKYLHLHGRGGLELSNAVPDVSENPL